MEVTSTPMKGKAIKGETDNVFKEHKMALNLRKKGVLIIPIYVASLGKTQSGRDSFIKLDQEKALKMFDDREDDPAIHQRLQDVKNTLASIFDIPGVNIEPDTIPEKVPKIVEMWYDRFIVQKHISYSQQLILGIKAFYNNWIRNPSQGFRLIVIGMIMGFGIIFSLVLLFMPSKSRKHTDIKKGVAIGNILGLLVVIIVCTFFYYGANDFASGMYCTECEAMLSLEGSNGEAVGDLYEAIPGIDWILQYCGCNTNDAGWLDKDCLQCTCNEIYYLCGVAYAEAEMLEVLIILAVLLIVATAAFVYRFAQLEAYSLSF